MDGKVHFGSLYYTYVENRVTGGVLTTYSKVDYILFMSLGLDLDRDFEINIEFKNNSNPSQGNYNSRKQHIIKL